MALCSFVDTNGLEERFLSIFRASQWMGTFLRNSGTILPRYTAPYLRIKQQPT